MSETCAICLDVCTGTVRAAVTCPKCTTSCCKVCLKTHLLNLIDDPHCPNCRFGYTRTFLLESLPKNFFTGAWADHRRAVLWEREKAYLPEAQIHIERMKEANELAKELKPIYAQIIELNKQREVLRMMAATIERNVQRLREGLPIEEGGAASSPEVQKFVRKCPATNCKGFLSTQWKCGLCDNYCCRECLVPRGPDRDAPHTCAEADLATAKLIARDSKPCPKCGEFIHRAEGCANMFCTSCKTAFNWNTMKIQEGGYIDNPHYFEYAAEHGMLRRNPGDNPCGPQLPRYSVIEQLADYRSGRYDVPIYIRAQAIRNLLGDLYGRVTTHYNAHNEQPDTLELRVQYLSDQTNEETIKRFLMNQERKRERHRAIRQVIDTFVAAGCDIFHNLVASVQTALGQMADGQTIREIRCDRFDLTMPLLLQEFERRYAVWTAEWAKASEQFDQLRDFCNKAFADVSKTYSCTTPRITDEFYTTSIKG